jgi:hypothetical protein
MKNLTALISLFAIASLAVLAVASALGVCSPSWSVASRMIGLSCAAGMLAIFATDYAPRRSYGVNAVARAAGANREYAPAVRTAVSQPRMVPAQAQPLMGATTAGVMATLGLTNDSATLSMS